jgi:MFS family permease
MTHAAAHDFTEMDNAKISKEHWKIMLISGMGFFTDAYDLFVIGVVMSLVKPIWHIGKVEESLVDSTALLAAALGALLFGRVADMLGRRRIYGVEVLVLAAGVPAISAAQKLGCLVCTSSTVTAQLEHNAHADLTVRLLSSAPGLARQS